MMLSSCHFSSLSGEKASAVCCRQLEEEVRRCEGEQEAQLLLW